MPTLALPVCAQASTAAQSVRQASTRRAAQKNENNILLAQVSGQEREIFNAIEEQDLIPLEMCSL
jgi:hypothetical protein